MVRDRSLAEDLLQDTFYDALRAQEQLPQVENERAWLYGIARHRALRALRRRRRFQRAVVRLAGSREEGHEGDEAVVTLLDLLDLLERELGFQAVELAEMTGLSPEVVRQRLARARARLLAATPAERKEA